VARVEREPLNPAETEEAIAEKGTANERKKTRGQKVKQAKIVRESNKVDALTGKGRSRGYGFLELHKHEDALRVLRWTNNNRTVGDLWDGWWKSEVQELLKRGKGEGEEGAIRVKKLKEEAQREETRWKATKKTLIVEFSVENIQVTERRKSRRVTNSGPGEPKEEKEDSSETQRPEKRQRTSQGPKSGKQISKGGRSAPRSLNPRERKQGKAARS